MIKASDDRGNNIEVAHNFYEIFESRIQRNKQIEEAINSNSVNHEEILALEESLGPTENITISFTPIKQGHVTLLTYIDNKKSAGPPIIVTVENYPKLEVIQLPKTNTIPGVFLKFEIKSNFKNYSKFEENVAIKIVDSSKRFLRYKHLNSVDETENEDEFTLKSTFGFTPNRPGQIIIGIVCLANHIIGSPFSVNIVPHIITVSTGKKNVIDVATGGLGKLFFFSPTLPLIFFVTLLLIFTRHFNN
jgi:hypothetical protein